VIASLKGQARVKGQPITFSCQRSSISDDSLERLVGELEQAIACVSPANRLCSLCGSGAVQGLSRRPSSEPNTALADHLSISSSRSFVLFLLESRFDVVLPVLCVRDQQDTHSIEVSLAFMTPP
jgi:hypothetical protein